MPISQPWSQYNILYRDTTGAPDHDTSEWVRTGARSRVAIRPAEGHDTASHAHDTIGLRARVSGARERAVWQQSGSRYKICIVAEGGDFGLRYSTPGLQYRLRYSAQRPATRCRGTATRAVARNDRTRPGYPSKVPRVVPSSGVPLYNSYEMHKGTPPTKKINTCSTRILQLYRNNPRPA